MAAAEGVNKSHDKSLKKKPFAWVKKLTNFGAGRDHNGERKKSPKKAESYALTHENTTNIHDDVSRNGAQGDSHRDDSHRGNSVIVEGVDEQSRQRHSQAMTQTVNSSDVAERNCARSAAPTVHTNGDLSDAGQSKSATTSGMTAEASGNSIFSSSNHSARSLTTTLTTMQSTAPQGQLSSNGAANATVASSNHSQQPSQSSTYFSHQYPTTPTVSAVPTYISGPQSSHLPTTYRSATANNLLSDNASVMTLASSHHNRRVGDRRNSADTNASMRAIPPSSQWGGSRESLPLSTLSAATAEPGQQQGATTAVGSLYQTASSRPSIGGLASAERQSIYSASAMSPTVTGLVSERNSLYASSRVGTAADNASIRGLAGDANSIRGPLTDGGASIRDSSIRGDRGTDGASVHSSGLGGHGRNGSVAGSIMAASSGLRTGEVVDGPDDGDHRNEAKADL